MPYPNRSFALQRAILALLLMLSMALIACRGQAASTENFQVEIRVLTQPPTVGPAEVVVSIRDARGQPVEQANVQVEGDMRHAGMAPVRATAQPTGAGEYRTQDFAFTMGGDWVLTAQVSLPSGERFSHSVDVRGVASGSSAEH